MEMKALTTIQRRKPISSPTHTVTQRARYLVGSEYWHLYRDKVRVGQALYMDYYYDLRKNQTLGAYLAPEEQAQWFEHNALLGAIHF